MSRSPHEAGLRLGVCAQELVLLAASGREALCRVALADYRAQDGGVDWLAAISALATGAGLAGTQALAVTVSDHWVRYWIQPVPEGVGRLGELKALCATRFEQRFGLRPEAWEILADWQASGAMLACAMPARLLDVLRDPPDASWTLVSLQAESVRLLAQGSALEADAWVACAGASGVTLLCVEHGRFRHVRHHALAAAVSLEATLEAEALRHENSAARVLHVLGHGIGCRSGQMLAGLEVRCQDDSAAVADAGIELAALGARA